MSILQAAEAVRAHGRGNDSQLMHVTPREVRALQGIAMAKGGSLTINPHTGLPEAGFLEDILPTVVGIGVGALTGGAAAPFIGAAVAGLGSYALTGSLEKGIMSGLGAFGGASALSSLGAVGAAAPGAMSSVAPAAAATDIGLAAASDAALTGVGANVGSAMGGAGMTDMALAGAYDAGLSGVGANMPSLTGAERFAQMGAMDRLSSVGSGIKQLATDPSGTFSQMGGLKGQGMNLGMMAAPLLAAGSGSSSGIETPEQQDSYIRPFTYDQATRRYTAQTPVLSSDWGSRGFPGYAEGGEIEQRYERPVRTVDPAVAEYNNMLMQQAQKEYVQGIQTPIAPPTIQAPAQAAPVSATSPVMYDPATQRYMANPNYVDPKAAEKLRQQNMMNQGESDWEITQRLGYNPYADTGHGGGGAYASGGIVAASQLPRFQEGGEMESDAFVVPADVVSALGNGSTKAGVDVLNQYLGMAMLIEGEGDGLSDGIPATIEGTQAARVADGEVYIPADIVARLGEGDPEEGSEMLYEMMDKIRKAAHGKNTQQKEVNPEQVMPT